MTPTRDKTLDPTLRSWVESANDPASDFPIQNLPLGMFRRPKAKAPELGVAIGDQILVLKGSMAQSTRAAIQRVLRADNKASAKKARTLLVAQADVEMVMPVQVGNYSDFYASIHHATNVGSMLRPDNPLMPNYKWVPIGYHGRASSIVVSGTPIRRPSGQTRPDENAPPVFGPTKRLDYEVEIGAVIGRGNPLGQPIPLADADRHVLGLCLLNDWSARDVQTWEYQPLGPFLAKSFATTISPWIVTLDALEPFRVPLSPRAGGDPAPLPYLSDPNDAQRGGFAITVEAWLSSKQMRDRKIPAMRIGRGSMRDMYWTIGQLVAHHTSNGCNMQPGDIVASGTISGSAEESRGCLLERTWRGTKPLELPTGERRAFLEDGDEVVMRGYCEREGYRRIGFGECKGVILSAAKDLL